MSATTRIRRPHLTTVRRDDDRVSPLELFFDLVFVLALTQCTALMAHEPTWTGLAKGVAILGVMWWAWVGYTWAVQHVDPEEGAVRLVVFTAMAALLVVALAIPEAFGEEAAGLRRRLRRRARDAGRAARDRGPRGPGAAPLRRRPGDLDRDRRRPAHRRLVRRRRAAGRAVGDRARARRRRAARDRPERLAADARALRRAPRADRDHRARRVDRRDRRRRGGGRRDDRRRAGDRLRHGGRRGAVVAVLRRRGARRRPPAGERRARHGAEPRSRATRSPTCTSRWWPGSCCSRSGSRRRSSTPTRRSSSSRPRRCSAARRSTCSPTSPSAGATSTPSTGSGS